MKQTLSSLVNRPICFSGSDMVSFMEVMTDNRACCASRKSKIIIINYYHYYYANTKLNICSIG